MNKPSRRHPPPEDSAEIADAASFFRDFPTDDASAPQPPPTSDPGEYELLDAPVEKKKPTPPPAAPHHEPPPTPTRAERAPAREQPPTPSYQEDYEDVVDRVWNRWGEWGPTILRLVLIGAAWLFVLYVTLSAEHIGRTFFLFVLGLVAMGVCSYPILITLERPVRVTPEQALQDYFGSLNHWFPQYRRMWLLLASPRQDSPPLHSLAALQGYWKAKIGKLRTEYKLPNGPVYFTISGYKSDKSAGKSALVAKYNLDVRGTSDVSTPPIVSFADSQSLVRGPDRMWYLTKARMPERSKAPSSRRGPTPESHPD